MVDVFLNRVFEPPLKPEDVGVSPEDVDCFDLHRVEWQGSMLSSDGSRLLCHFSAPDTESARNALRQSNADIRLLWRGTVHDRPGLTEEQLGGANVLVERSFEEPVALDDIQALEDAGAWCLETYNVEFLRTFFSADRRQMICLYHAPDAESVRLAQRMADMPLERVWAFEAVRPPA